VEDPFKDPKILSRIAFEEIEHGALKLTTSILATMISPFPHPGVMSYANHRA
jgi:hypothetical protein